MKYLLIALLLAGCIPARSLAQNKHSNPLSLTELPDSTCNKIIVAENAMQNDGMFQQRYDTLQFYLESCPLQDGSWHLFNDINGAVSQWTDGGQGRWDDFLAFLKKVLYNNPDTMWYCSDALDMITAEQKMKQPNSQNLNI